MEAPHWENRTSCHPFGSPDEGEQETVQPGDQHLKTVRSQEMPPSSDPTVLQCYMLLVAARHRRDRLAQRMILRFTAYDRKTHFGKFRKGSSRRF